MLQSTLREIEPLRIGYLAGLPEFQDLYLEFLVGDAEVIRLQQGSETVGYALIHDGTVLIEFCLLHTIPDPVACFKTLLRDWRIEKVYCKSFDYQLFDCCKALNMQGTPIGWLYREFADRGLEHSGALDFRFAVPADLPFLQRQEDEVFEPKELLSQFVRDQGIVMAEQSGVLTGCGFLTRIHPAFLHYDLGVWVDHVYRQRGHATQILLYLKDLCESISGIPVCGCDYRNIASQRMLAKTGFISQHQLLEFTLPHTPHPHPTLSPHTHTHPHTHTQFVETRGVEPLTS